MFSMKLNASSDTSVTNSISWISAVVSSSAETGAPAVFSRRMNRGMSSSLAATNSTSAAISVHAR